MLRKIAHRLVVPGVSDSAREEAVQSSVFLMHPFTVRMIFSFCDNSHTKSLTRRQDHGRHF